MCTCAGPPPSPGAVSSVSRCLPAACAASMHAITSLRAIPRPRYSGLTPSIRRCASSGASGPALLGLDPFGELERRRPGDHSVDHGHEHGGYPGLARRCRRSSSRRRYTRAIRVARIRDTPAPLPPRPPRTRTRARGGCRCPRPRANPTRHTPVAGTAHRRGMDTEQPDAVDAEGSG